MAIGLGYITIDWFPDKMQQISSSNRTKWI